MQTYDIDGLTYMQIVMLESMLKDLLAPRIQPALDEINENGSYAILKVAN